jgi:hypothetical protein
MLRQQEQLLQLTTRSRCTQRPCRFLDWVVMATTSRCRAVSHIRWRAGKYALGRLCRNETLATGDGLSVPIFQGGSEGHEHT